MRTAAQLTLAIAFILPSGGAEEPAAATASVNLFELIDQALGKNPGILSARNRWRAAVQRYPQETALPDPMVKFRYREMEKELAVEQALPYPGTRRLQGEVVLKKVEMARLQYEAVARDTVAELKMSVYEVAYLSAAIELTYQNRDLLVNAVGIAQARYAQDKASLNDLLRAQSQLAQLNFDVIALRELEAAEKIKVRALLDRPRDSVLAPIALEPFSEIPLTLEGLNNAAIDHRQEILMTRAETERDQLSTKLAHKMNRPMFSVEAFVMQEKDGNAPGAMVGLTLPIWGTRNQARVREMDYMRRASAMDVKNMENMAVAEIGKIFFTLENSRRLVDLYKNQLIPQAAKSLELTETFYREGKGSFTDFLESQSTWLNFNLAHHRAMADYRMNIAKLEQLTGGPLPQKKETAEKAK